MNDNEFLANVKNEGEEFDFNSLVTEPEEKETPAGSPPETKPEGKTEPSAEEPKEEPEEPKEPLVEEPKPDAKVFHAFHEHPRWIAREKELKELRSKVEEYEDFKTRVEPFLEKLNKPIKEEPTNAPLWFTNLFGSDESAWQQYREANKTERQAIREEILNELRPELEKVAEVRQQGEMQEWANEQWRNLESNATVQEELKVMGTSLKNVQSEISDVMAKYKPSDEEGNISLQLSYELWKTMRKSSPKPNPIISEKKKVAAISKEGKEEEPKGFRTSADFVGKGIHDLID